MYQFDGTVDVTTGGVAEPMIDGLVGRLDRDLPVPVGVQLRGLLEYGIALGELPVGQRLPSVRALAQRMGIAPMTVASVYAELRDCGLLEGRQGAGTYIADRGGQDRGRMLALRRIQRKIDALLAEAEALGLAPNDVAAQLNARLARGRGGAVRPLALVMVGLFPDATQVYADCIAAQLGPQDRITATTIAALQAGDYPPRADLVVTLANRRAEVEALFPPGMPVIGISFIPSEETRGRLAAIDPGAKLAIVSMFPEFLALMKPGVLRFTPHVADVEVGMYNDPDLGDLLARCDVLVYATGAESLLARLPPGRQALEYRHVPDPNAIRAELLPAVERVRATLPVQEEKP